MSPHASRAGNPAEGARANLRALGEQAFSRAAGAPLVAGNRLTLLLDAEENFPAWLAAIEGARRDILLEAYILADDARLGFVTGLGIADRWVGDPSRGTEPWRDTGVEVAGPAVADLAHAFSRAWAEQGPPIP